MAWYDWFVFGKNLLKNGGFEEGAWPSRVGEQGLVEQGIVALCFD